MDTCNGPSNKGRITSCLVLIVIIIGCLMTIPALADTEPSSPTPTTESTTVSSTKPRERRVVQISKTEFCMGCRTLIEEFYLFAKQNVFNIHKHSVDLTTTGVQTQFCEGAFGKYREGIRNSCMKLSIENLTETLTPFLGSNDATNINNQRRVFDHMHKFCADVHACEPYSPEPKKMNKCDTCRTVARDFYWGMTLWDVPHISPQAVTTTLQNTCTHIGTRHNSWLSMDELCHDLLDDHVTKLPSLVLTRNAHYDRIKHVSTAGTSGEWIINAEVTIIDNICNGHGIYNVCRGTAPSLPPPGGYLKPAASSPSSPPPPIRIEHTNAASPDEIHDDL